MSFFYCSIYIPTYNYYLWSSSINISFFSHSRLFSYITRLRFGPFFFSFVESIDSVTTFRVIQCIAVDSDSINCWPKPLVVWLLRVRDYKYNIIVINTKLLARRVLFYNWFLDVRNWLSYYAHLYFWDLSQKHFLTFNFVKYGLYCNGPFNVFGILITMRSIESSSWIYFSKHHEVALY